MLGLGDYESSGDEKPGKSNITRDVGDLAADNSRNVSYATFKSYSHLRVWEESYIFLYLRSSFRERKKNMKKLEEQQKLTKPKLAV